jgi:multiple sugar transport system substrate-binding protein
MGVSAAAACIALVIAGCSGNAPSNGPTASVSAGTPSNGTPSEVPTASTGSGTDSPYGFPAAEQVADSPITIWVDADRTAIVEAFKKDHPEIKVNSRPTTGTPEAATRSTPKISLFDQAGEGWPDVVWSTQVNDASWAAKEQNGVRPSPLRSTGRRRPDLARRLHARRARPVTVDGNVYGARDNLAPVVFWYNKTLFDQFGYTIPTTWEAYEALGDKVAAEHPGYILGSIGTPSPAVDQHVERSGPDLPGRRHDVLERLRGRPHHAR